MVFFGAKVLLAVFFAVCFWACSYSYRDVSQRPRYYSWPWCLPRSGSIYRISGSALR